MVSSNEDECRWFIILSFFFTLNHYSFFIISPIADTIRIIEYLKENHNLKNIFNLIRKCDNLTT